jgi:hypothetical protein
VRSQEICVRPLLLFALLAPSLSGQSSLGFEQNTGDYPPAVRFIRRSIANYYYVTRDSVVFNNGVRVQLSPVDPPTAPTGDTPSSLVLNMYRGPDASTWLTNAPLFDAVRLPAIYTGADARITATNPNPASLVQIALTFQAGADLTRFRLTVLNTGASAMVAPGGEIWYTSDKFPGVFALNVQATQGGGALPASLKIETSGSLSIAAPSLNPALTSQFQITFSSFEGISTRSLTAALTG